MGTVCQGDVDSLHPEKRDKHFQTHEDQIILFLVFKSCSFYINSQKNLQINPITSNSTCVNSDIDNIVTLVNC